ncbi:unnamed protein product, partial [Effrenium voratum]
NFGFGFKDPKDVFKEMFGTSDPFADFGKFFEDVKFEEFGGDADAATAELEQALAAFYTSVGQPDKASPEQVRSVLHSEKWRGKEQKMFASIQKKYNQPQHEAPLKELKKAFEELSEARQGGFDMGGFDMGGFDMGGMGGMGGFDLGGMFGGLDFGGSGGGGTVMFSSSFSSSNGKTTKSETRMENGRRVTKTIESDARGGTRAMMEEQEGNRIRRTSGSKPAERLPGDEM